MAKLDPDLQARLEKGKAELRELYNAMRLSADEQQFAGEMSLMFQQQGTHAWGGMRQQGAPIRPIALTAAFLQAVISSEIWAVEMDRKSPNS